MHPENILRFSGGIKVQNNASRHCEGEIFFRGVSTNLAEITLKNLFSTVIPAVISNPGYKKGALVTNGFSTN